MKRRRTILAVFVSLLTVLICGSHGARDSAGGQPEATDKTRAANPPPGRPIGDRAASETVVTNSIGMRLVRIPPGEFQMGSSDEFVEKERHAHNFRGDSYTYFSHMLDDERPQHKVRIKNAYFLAATETTQQEYQRVVGSNPSHFRGDPRRPVDSVSWYDAVDFCKKLSDLPDERAAKRQYQLPTEAQWEYACRAGNQKAWFFSRHEGTTSEDRKLLGEYAWFSDDSCRLRDDVSRLTTHPVAQKKPNGWGLYDMYGNVFEWCQDWYAPYSSAPAVDPTGPSGNLVQPASGWRIQRGGAFFRSEFWCRSALRGMSNPEFRREHTGFRVCAVAIPNSGDTNSGDTHGVPGTHN